MSTSIDKTPHYIASELYAEYEAGGADLNEADTRHRYIDVILHDVLGWPRAALKLEEHCREGFMDYALQRQDGNRILIIEAKREGIFFNAPAPSRSGVDFSFTKVRTLLTDPVVKDVISQVRNYCIDVGVQFAVITNGHQWIFFRTFQQGQAWDDLRAFVVHSLRYFSVSFINASEYLAYDRIVKFGSLNNLLGDSPLYNRELYFPKEQISSFSAPIDKNQYSQYLRPVVDRFFKAIDPSDADFISACYVRDGDAKAAFASAQVRLQDAVTPFLEQYGVVDFKDDGVGGKFARRLSKSITRNKNADVVVLFGGKGVGKSTFLRTLLYYSPPQILKKNAVISLIDLLDTPETDRNDIYQTIWTNLVSDLDVDNLLSSSRESLGALFQDRFDVALRQDLFGLHENTDRYNEKLNLLIREWKGDKKYCAQRLALHWAHKHKAPIVVIDNTDQYSRDIQEFCFATAQEISHALGCLTIVSMREERFYESSIRGTLDAYQNSGFHISSPVPQEVFSRRLAYVISLLSVNNSRRDSLIAAEVDPEVFRRCVRLFQIYESEFRNPDSHLSNFLTACAHGNVRLALDLFRGIVTSGYTNVFEMTTPNTWNVQVHQVIKPIMIPSRFFYEESRSAIPNIYQVRGKKFGSHFTALRILSRLAQGADVANPPFLPSAVIVSEIDGTFGMIEDCRSNLDMLLKFRLIEANNRMDEYSSELDGVRITAYGLYLYKELSRAFSYLDLVSCDCAVFSKSVSQEISFYSNSEYQLFSRGERVARLEARIKRARRFIEYLEQDEAREIQFFALQSGAAFMPKVREGFEADSARAMRSAKKQRDR